MTALINLFNTDHQALIDWVRKEYGLGVNAVQSGNVHRVRREKIAARLALYRDQLEIPLSQVIGKIYETPKMQETLKEYICVSAGQNVSRRIVNEVASLYDRTALRQLATREEEFRAEEKRLQLHFIHQEAHRLVNLCNEVMIWQFKGIDDQTALRIVTPNLFDAVPDPRDTLIPAGILNDCAPMTMLGNATRLPHWELWDDTYRYRINGEGRMVDAMGGVAVVPEEHGLGRIPGVLLHRRQPTTCILDASYGEDIKSTHLAVALIDVMIMRLSKTQGENQPILQGNLAAMASGQVMNGETPLALPPDVVVSMLNMKTSPEHYLEVKRDKLTSVAQTYGMSYEMFTNSENSDSGKLYAMRREKLTELRLEQRGRAMLHEAQVVELMGFDSKGLRVDFQEQAAPADASEEVALLDTKMRKGLDSPVDFVMRKDPDLTRDAAKQKILDNLGDFAMLVIAQRALNMPGDADAGNPGKSPQQNGAARPGDPDSARAAGDTLANDGSTPPAPDYRAIAKEILDAA
jgi:hypothetical protein